MDLLKLGLNFCPSEDINKFESVKDMVLFARKLNFNLLFDDKTFDSNETILNELSQSLQAYSIQEFQTLQTLTELCDGVSYKTDDDDFLWNMPNTHLFTLLDPQLNLDVKLKKFRTNVDLFTL